MAPFSIHLCIRKRGKYKQIIELSIKYSKESTKTYVCSKLGIKWLKWGEYILKIEDNNSMKRGQQWEANWIPLNG